jgi:hypothetical protein
MAKEVMTVKWVLPAKNLIKFNEKKDDTYDIEAVKDYIKDVKPKDKVEVEIDGEKVVFISKSGKTSKTTKKTDVKKEEPKETVKEESTVSDWQEMTVKAMTKDKSVVKFEESDVAWFQVTDKAKFENIKAKDKIRVKLGEVKVKGKMKPAVIELENIVKTEDNASDYSPSTYVPSDKDATNNSIERQVSLKEAGAIVRTMIEAGREEVNTIKKISDVLKKLTKDANEALNQ